MRKHFTSTTFAVMMVVLLITMMANFAVMAEITLREMKMVNAVAKIFVQNGQDVRTGFMTQHRQFPYTQDKMTVLNHMLKVNPKNW